MVLQPPAATAVFLTVEDLAKRWHKSEHTIRSDASRAPGALPPICRLPGQKRLLWRVADVEAYESGYVVIPSCMPTAPPISRPRGRPPGTTTSAMRRRRNAERAAMARGVE